MQINFQSNIPNNLGQNNTSNKSFNRLSKTGLLLVILAAVVFLGAVGTSIYFYKQANSNPQVDQVKELERMIKLVGKHIVLPVGETPTMATVSDPEKLKDQPFFINAKKGDVVLIFSDSRKAILYDPIGDKIVEVAPINSQAGLPTAN